MKYFIYIVFTVLFINVSATAQTENASTVKIEDLSVKIENNNLQINWSSNTAGEANYWEVQGSKDGKEFSTIGMVLGSDPVKGDYKYKQSLAKLKSGLKYYRVLHVESDDKAFASNTISVSK